MKKIDVPYKYYRCTLVGSWAFAALCVIGTWLAFQIGNPASITFSLIVDIFLTLSLGLLTGLLFVSERPDFRKKAWGVLAADIVHLVFFILIAIVGMKEEMTDQALYALPAVHTLILIAIVALGIYYYSRGKFVFKNMAREDAAKAFGGTVEADQTTPSDNAPSEPQKPARDEKTGIVSL